MACLFIAESSKRIAKTGVTLNEELRKTYSESMTKNFLRRLEMPLNVELRKTYSESMAKNFWKCKIRLKIRNQSLRKRDKKNDRITE